MPSRLPKGLLEFLVVRVAPCLLCCDAEGEISERVNPATSLVPADIRNANSLRACLSKPLCDELLALVADCLCRRVPMDMIVVLDGVAFDLTLLPAPELQDHRRIWISILPLANRSASDGSVVRRTLQHHEWGVIEVLSSCQLDTLRSITLGLSNQQIAQRMHRSKRAVEWHIRHIHRLLGAGAREHLSRLGRHAGLDAFRDVEWEAVLGTRPSRRTLEAFGRDGSPRVA